MNDPQLQPEAIVIDVSLVRRLISAQFPRWAGLPIKPVAFDGWDNRTFHLGEHLKVRLPSAACYAGQVEKEYRWLPELAPLLPLPIPVPLAMGMPTGEYPWHWSVCPWLDGETAAVARIADLSQLAKDLAQFLSALQAVDGSGGPLPDQRNFFRGGPLQSYNAETRAAIMALQGEIDTDMVTEAWKTGLAATWHGTPVWLHGDVSAGNLLVKNSRLHAVIDFGCSAVGDPACDLVMAWIFFQGDSRAAFHAALPLDSATWQRARGWALWKALITLREHLHTDSLKAKTARRVIDEVLSEHRRR